MDVLRSACGAAVISESAAAEKVECRAATDATLPPAPLPWLSGAGARGIVPWRMDSRLFLPTARQTNWLLLIGLLSLGEALYLRYLAIEYAQVSLACQAGLDTWLCATFRLVIILYNHSVFGWVALAAAVLNVIRPSILLVAVGLAAAAFGLVLHNANLAGVAAALLILSLARPAPAAE
jgi:hypothetical protein